MANHFSDQVRDYDSFSVPPEFKPMGAWAYFLYSVLFAIPIIGLICLIVFSFSDANINRRNYARSIFISIIFAAILYAVLYFTGVLNDFNLIINEGKWPAYLSFLPWVSA